MLVDSNKKKDITVKNLTKTNIETETALNLRLGIYFTIFWENSCCLKTDFTKHCKVKNDFWRFLVFIKYFLYLVSKDSELHDLSLELKQLKRDSKNSIKELNQSITETETALSINKQQYDIIVSDQRQKELQLGMFFVLLYNHYNGPQRKFVSI